MDDDGEQGSDQLDLDRADAYGRSFADVYDSWYADVTDADGTARFIAKRRPNGLVVELGVGSGRLAIPMSDAGLRVVGVDGSAAMLDRLPKAQPGRNVAAIRADMRDLPFTGTVDVVLIAFNTLFNLANEREQKRLLHALSPLISPGGILAIEALLEGPQDSIGVHSSSKDGVVVTATQLDRAGQTVSGQHVEITDGSLSVRPWRLRWLTPDQLDRLATGAGLELMERFGDWDERPFTDQSESHISIYRPTTNA